MKNKTLSLQEIKELSDEIKQHHEEEILDYILEHKGECDFAFGKYGYKCNLCYFKIPIKNYFFCYPHRFVQNFPSAEILYEMKKLRYILAQRYKAKKLRKILL